MKALKILALGGLIFILAACVPVEKPAEKVVDKEEVLNEEISPIEESITTYENTIYGYKFDYPGNRYDLSITGMEDLTYGKEKYGVQILSQDFDKFEISPILSDYYPEFEDHYTDTVKEAFQEKDIKKLAEMSYELNKNNANTNIVEEFNETSVGSKQAFQFVLSNAESTGFDEKQGGSLLNKPTRIIYVFDGTTFYKIHKSEENSTLDEVLKSLSFSTEETTTVEKPAELSDENYDYYLVCDNNKFPFKLDEIGGGHGQFVFTGTIVEELEQRIWSFDEMDLIPVIRMEVDDADIAEALDYYKGMVDEGNGINNIKNEKLRFRIGNYENEEFSSTAKISDTTLDNIFKALDSGEEISLTLTQTFLPGMGAPENISFACEIAD